MVVGTGSISDEVLELCTLQVAWHHLALGERTECGGVAYLAAELHAGYRGLQVVWVRHSIRFNLNGIERIDSTDGPQHNGDANRPANTSTTILR
jgi:hypothetical protein